MGNAHGSSREQLLELQSRTNPGWGDETGCVDLFTTYDRNNTGFLEREEAEHFFGDLIELATPGLSAEERKAAIELCWQDFDDNPRDEKLGLDEMEAALKQCFQPGACPFRGLFSTKFRKYDSNDFQKLVGFGRLENVRKVLNDSQHEYSTADLFDNFTVDPPLHLAAFLGHMDMLDLLLPRVNLFQVGGHPEHHNGGEFTVVHCACISPHPDAVRRDMLKVILEVCRRSDEWSTPAPPAEPDSDDEEEPLPPPDDDPDSESEPEEPKPKPKPAVAKWTCPACTLLCSGTHCDACGYARPARKDSISQPWDCKACTFENVPGATHCQVCGQSRPPPAPGSPPPPRPNPRKIVQKFPPPPKQKKKFSPKPFKARTPKGRLFAHSNCPAAIHAGTPLEILCSIPNSQLCVQFLLENYSAEFQPWDLVKVAFRAVQYNQPGTLDLILKFIFTPVPFLQLLLPPTPHRIALDLQKTAHDTLCHTMNQSNFNIFRKILEAFGQQGGPRPRGDRRGLDMVHLMHVCCSNRGNGENFAKILLEFHADPNAHSAASPFVSNPREHLIDVACQNDNANMISFLVENGADTSAVPNKFQPSVQRAIAAGLARAKAKMEVIITCTPLKEVWLAAIILEFLFGHAIEFSQN